MIWTALLLALCPRHASAWMEFLKPLPQDFFETLPNCSDPVNLTQFMLKNQKIWTVLSSTKYPNATPATCEVAIPTNVSRTNVMVHTNWTDNPKRYSEDLNGYFLDPEEGPTSLLLMDPDEKGTLWLDILIYLHPDKLCGVFYYIVLESTWLWHQIKTAVSSQGTYHKVDLKKHLDDATVYGYQCQIREGGNSTHPYLSGACNDTFNYICKNFTPHVVYNSSCYNTYSK